MRGGTLALALLLTVAAGPAAAQALADLGQVTVTVDDQGDAARDAGFSAAVTDVLVRLTGRPDVVESAAVEGIVEDAGRFVQQFRYQRDDDGGLQLRTRFDTNALREALVRAEVPVWQRDRPPVLVWLAVERGSRREMVGSEQGAAEREAMLAAAAELGLPLLFPLMDLEDQRRVGFADVAGGFAEPVLAASQRYDTPVVLAGRLRATGSGWEGRWSLYGPDAGRERWSDRAPALAGLAGAAIARVAAVLREPYTLLPDLGRSSALQVRVTGLRGLDDFAAAERALAALGGVSGVQPEEIRGDLVEFRLQVNVAPDRVRRALERERRFEVADPPRPALEDGDGEALERTVELGSAPTYRLRR